MMSEEKTKRLADLTAWRDQAQAVSDMSLSPSEGMPEAVASAAQAAAHATYVLWMTLDEQVRKATGETTPAEDIDPADLAALREAILAGAPNRNKELEEGFALQVDLTRDDLQLVQTWRDGKKLETPEPLSGKDEVVEKSTQTETSKS